MQHVWQFWKQWFAAPRRVGALAPSSRFLAAAMAREVVSHSHGQVVELGPGTGAITRGLLRVGIREDRLVLVERSPQFADGLQRRFPRIQVLRADAKRLHAVLERAGVSRVAAIVSSLPLLSFPKPLRQEISQVLLDYLPEGAVLVQFTYGPKPPISRAYAKKHGVEVRRAAKVWLNLPPATVWVYVKG